MRACLPKSRRAAAVIVATTFAGGLAPAGASQWSCRNETLEVSCRGGDCSAVTDFTPMSISLSDERLSVCTYSGCWEGTATVLRSGDLVSAQGRDLRWSHDSDAEGEDALLTFDITKGLGAIVILGYVNPLLCR